VIAVFANPTANFQTQLRGVPDAAAGTRATSEHLKREYPNAKFDVAFATVTVIRRRSVGLDPTRLSKARARSSVALAARLSIPAIYED